MIQDLNSVVQQEPKLNKMNTVTTHRARKKIIICFLLVSLVPISIVGVISFFNSRGTINKISAQYSLDFLTQTVANIQLKLAEFENISLRLFINNDFNNTLINYLKIKDGASELQKKVIVDYFNEYMISNQDVFAFLFISETKTDKSIIVAKDYYQDFLDLTKHFRQTSSYKSIIKAGGGIVWSTTIKLNRNHFVILGRYIKDLTTGQPLGILAIVVDEDKIDQLVNMTIYNQLNISFSEIDNYLFIINNEGEIISSPFKEEIGKNINQIMKDTEPLKSILGSPVSNRDYGCEINQGSYITEVNHKQMLVTFKSIGSKIGVGGKSGWILVSLAPTSYLYKQASAISYTTLILGIIFGILAILASFYVANLVNNKSEDKK
ncbi:MAG TPA: hypothetical protein DDW65_11770 [Firmicutes bacterium]|jgi:methyl-accepting chemotaxis protein|nr:hypothetical protein [Bacillota bacterium]